MNPRKPYNPRRKVPGLQRPGRAPEGKTPWPPLWVALPLLAVIGLAVWRAELRLKSENAVPTPTPEVFPVPSAASSAMATARLPSAEPTTIFFPTAAPSPTAITRARPAPTQFYETQPGDTLSALAARFGVNPADIIAPQGLQGSTTLIEGQRLVIPRALDEVGPGDKIIPDSEFVHSASATGFDPRQFAQEQGGYLASYKGFADEATRWGGDLVLLAARNHSINPRLLLALLEYQSGWVTNPRPQGEALLYPFGYAHSFQDMLYSELAWATRQLAIGYYGWRAGRLTGLRFPDGATLRLDPTLNAGTVAVHYFFAQLLNRPAWDAAVSENGLALTYRALFGDPFAHVVHPLIPGDLTQPPLTLPFIRGHRWYFTGGPHGAWENGGALAALDFAPSSLEGGCAASAEWVTAVAAGQIVRADHGSVLLDLDGDGRETTGWAILYLHIADEDRIEPGAFVETGDLLGHPSCRGGQATGTHVHIARQYNGEWILADSVIPFSLSGWIAHQGEAEYLGSLTRGDQTVEACPCSAADTAITADP